MARMIMVYFHNGCKAQFDVDKVRFVGMARAGIDPVLCMAAVDAGIALVNFENVSFIQPVKEEKDEL